MASVDIRGRVRSLPYNPAPVPPSPDNVQQLLIPNTDTTGDFPAGSIIKLSESAVNLDDAYTYTVQSSTYNGQDTLVTLLATVPVKIITNSIVVTDTEQTFTAQPYSIVDEQKAIIETTKKEQLTQQAKADLEVKSGKWASVNLDPSLLPESILELFDSALSALEKVTDVITPVLKFLQFFVSSFNSFSSILKSLIEIVQDELNEFGESLGGAGVYFNVLFPPSLRRDMVNNKTWQNLSTGGFDGFVKRLQVSLRNTSDVNRPKFSNDGTVGGLIIMVDATTADAFYRTVKQLSNLFDFMDLLPLNTSPPPPRNIESYPVYTEEDGYGIRLKWDASPGTPITTGGYRISRSYIPGGRRTMVDDIPEKLGGKDGFLRAIRYRLSNLNKGDSSWPKKEVFEYDDPDFGGPKFVNANIVNGGGSFLDRNIPLEGDEPKYDQYYYVIESGWQGDSPTDSLFGPRSAEIVVPVQKKCIDPDSVAVVTHDKGFKELISAGWGGLGSWSSLQLKYSIPYMTTLLDMMNNLLNSLKGMLKSNSDSFGEFIDTLSDKIKKYLGIVELMITIVNQIKSMIIGPNAAFLYLAPEEGGINRFMDRVRSAQQPSGGFSGPSGITGGIVFVFGEVRSNPFGDDDQEKIQEEAEALERAFDILMSLFTGGD